MRQQSVPARLATALLAAVSTLAGCSLVGPAPDRDQAGPDAVAAALAAGLVKRDVAAVPFVGTTGAEVNGQLAPLVAGMGPLRPAVSVAGTERSGDDATATLEHTWRFPGVAQAWTYTTQAGLSRVGGAWQVRWQPSVVEPGLDGAHRLSQRRLYPERGELRGENGEPIVVERPVFRIGLDKAEVGGDAARVSARRLARLVGIDPKAYAAKVAGAGPSAFVEAIVLRRDAPDLPRGADIRAIPGALSIQDARMLAPTREFARPIIGTVGEATKDAVAAGRGAVVTGDLVGLSGLQKRYDGQLRGTPGVRVQLVPTSSATPTPSAPAGPSASPSPSATGGTPAATPAETTLLFEQPATAGQPLTTTLRPGLQRLAESVLSEVEPASALVALRPSDGAILAAANGPGNRDQSIATVGQLAPGSTFKVVSSLALLRAGLTPSSPVDCPRTLNVDGRTFRNYSDYPAGRLGRIDLRTAVAQSCNTAFIGKRAKLAGTALADAAASLGLGRDYDVGFPAYFGQVPEKPRGTALAAAAIGQGTVQASPLALAAVAASVAAGHTVVPHLIAGEEAVPAADQLTHREAAQLRELMRAVVTEGSGRRLATLGRPAVLAKTGTAEYGSSRPLKTHAWMIAAQGDLAVAVFVQDGKTGSQTAGPLLQRFLARAG